MARRKAEDEPVDGTSVESEGKKLIAKKDWRILSGSWDKASDRHEVDIQIKKGDDVGRMNIPGKFLSVLKTEQVI